MTVFMKSCAIFMTSVLNMAKEKMAMLIMLKVQILQDS